MRACLRWEQQTGRTFMGTSGRSFLLGCWSHWVKSAHTRCFVYANHAGNVVTWHLHTGIFVYVMNVPIIVGRSMFGLEFVATRITRDSIVALRYNIYEVAGILQVGKAIVQRKMRNRTRCGGGQQHFTDSYGVLKVSCISSECGYLRYGGFDWALRVWLDRASCHRTGLIG